MVDFSMVMKSYKHVKDIAERMKNADLLEALVSLREQLLDAKEEILDLREKNLQLSKTEDIESELEYHKDLYYRPGAKIEGPFCTLCWLEDRKLMPLVYSAAKRTGPYDFDENYYCLKCGKSYSSKHIDHQRLPSADRRG